MSPFGPFVVADVAAPPSPVELHVPVPTAVDAMPTVEIDAKSDGEANKREPAGLRPALEYERYQRKEIVRGS